MGISIFPIVISVHPSIVIQTTKTGEFLCRDTIFPKILAIKLLVIAQMKANDTHEGYLRACNEIFWSLKGSDYQKE